MTVSNIEEMHQMELSKSKAGVLLICMGSSTCILQQINGPLNKGKCDACKPLSDKQSHVVFDKRLSTLQESSMKNDDFRSLSTERLNKLNPLRSVPKFTETKDDMRCCATSRLNVQSGLSKSVRVCVYNKGKSPYLVIYQSTAKYASPVFNLKLRNCRIAHSIVNASNTNDEIEEKRFHLYPNMSDDVIIFQAANKSACEDWVKYITPLTKYEASSFAPQKTHYHIMRSSLPTLAEAEEPAEGLQQKAPRRQKSREGRRSSLTLAGALLPRRSLLRPLA